MSEAISINDENAAERQTVHFAAVLHPHASLSPRAFMIMMAVLATFSFALGGLSVALGIWPIFGFYGLDILGLYIAFRVSYRRARRYETIELTDDALTVERIDPRGRRERFALQPYWLRVEIDDPPVPGSRLLVASHGRKFEIGAFLTPAEKLDFARALKRELARLRMPLHARS
jgi:uncharacterized membrane protein